MANRLPTVGQDSGNWGTILNAFLGTEHNTADGTHKMGTGLITENVNTISSSGSTQIIPAPSIQTISNITLSENCAITLPTAVAGQSFTLVLHQSNPGGQTVTWTGNIKWPSSLAPTLSTTANTIDVLGFFSVDGVTWIGSLGIQDAR